MSRPTPRPLVPVVIVLFLSVAVVGPTAASGASWFDRGSAAFAGFLEAISAIWSEEGCGIDGNGRCGEGQAVAADPGGRQGTANEGAAVEREAGCGIDGNGGCHP